MRYGKVMLAVAVGAVIAAATGQPAVAAGGAGGGEVVQRVIRDTTGAGASVVEGTVRLEGMTVRKARTPSGEAVQTLVQTTPEATSVFAVLGKGQSQVHFDGLLPTGHRFEEAVDGGLVVVNDDNAITHVIEAPWAKDAAGKWLPTRYSTVGTRIVQQVDTAGAVFPVVADPKVKPGTWRGVIPVLHVHFTWTETWKIKNNMDAGASAVHEACGMLRGPAVAACRAGATILAQDVRNNVNAAIREKKCLALRLLASGGAIIWAAYDAYRRTCDE